AAFIMNLSGKMVKGTTVQFQREQSMLLAKSYTEYAIMAVTANDQNATCLNTINGSYNDYNITVDISYIGHLNILNGGCSRILNAGNDVITDKSPLNIIVDVFVDYPDYDHPDNLKMTYHRRSLQKI
ncbi:MAG: type II secretion system protein, partial [Sulfurimonadaceae bacterium]